MNHFTHDVDQSADTTDAQAISSAPSTPSVDAESTLQKIEDHLSRLKRERTDHSVAPASNFDALDYAKLSAAPRKAEFGEADPYVDSSETLILDTANPPTASGQSEPDGMPPAKTIDEILQKLSNYHAEIESNESNESNEADASHPNSGHSTAEPEHETQNDSPDVEVIAQARNNESPTDVDAPLVSSTYEPTSDLADDDSPPVTWFTDALSAIDELGGTNESETILLEASPAMAVPLVHAVDEENPESTEIIYDKRDFGDSADGVVELIPGSQEVEPDFFEFHAGNPSISETNQPAELQRPLDQAQLVDQNEEDQIFVANPGDIIRINGADGFSYIDLACFEVQQATFQKQVIKIDSGNGDEFEVHHQNIPYALFADGVEVDLTPDEAQSQIKKN